MSRFFNKVFHSYCEDLARDARGRDLSVPVSSQVGSADLVRRRGAANLEEAFVGVEELLKRIPRGTQLRICTFVGRKSGSGFDLDVRTEVPEFRVNGTGNYIGFCDSGGAETTRDTSVVPDGSTVQRLSVVRSGSTVQFFRNGAQVGADVTTNITGSTLIGVCGIRTLTTAAKTLYFSDFLGMGGAS